MTRPASNTCHVCLRSAPADAITDGPLCDHKTCSSCLVEVEIDESFMRVCDKCSKNKDHRHPTGHRYIRRT